MTVLGISTSTRLLGLAIITNDRLAAYQVCQHKISWSPSKANLIISSLEPCVRQYCINKVVLSIPPKHHQTSTFHELMNTLRNYFSEKNIPVYTQNATSLYAFCQEGVKPSKMEIMKQLATQFPQLKRHYHKELRNKTRYYMKLFEAVGVAVLHSGK